MVFPNDIMPHNHETNDSENNEGDDFSQRTRRRRLTVAAVVPTMVSRLSLSAMTLLAIIAIITMAAAHDGSSPLNQGLRPPTRMDRRVLHTHNNNDGAWYKRQRESPVRGEQSSSYSQYVGYHARDRNGQSEELKSFYGYPDDEETTTKSWFEEKYEETTLWDVWMCWGLAVAWAAWMLGSFVKSELLRYGQDSIMVRGNVRMVTLDEASLGTGIPIYKAVIDYMIPVDLCNGRYDTQSPYPYPPGTAPPPPPAPSHFPASTMSTYSEDVASRPTLQIRKEFETLHPLEQGFGNVELLVLHHEPTTSIIKEDWEQQVMEEMEESRSRRASKATSCGCITSFCRCIDGVFCGFGKDEYGEHLIWKRIWISFCLLMMLVAMAGSVLAVHRLPIDTRRLGWLCLCLEGLLVIPLALAIRLAVTSIQRRIVTPNRAGFVVGNNSNNSPSVTPTTPTRNNYSNSNTQQHPGLTWGEDSAGNDNHFCMDPSDVLDVQICEEDEVESLKHSREQYQHQHVDDPDYVVRLRPMQRDSSEVSDMSNNSHSMPLNALPSPGDEGSGDSNESVGKKESTPIQDGVMA